jgi:23S rRNA (cytosine1962-C5)-methyltransferase
VVRPCLQAVWPRHCSAAEWERADAVFVRHTNGNGHWECREPLPDSWPVECGGLRWLLKATAFGHLGLFPEQEQNWRWLTEQTRNLGRPGLPALNLFAYTGGSTFAMARGGARVTHVDAARGVVDWARHNAEVQGVPADRVRWIVDDVMKYCHRERKRGRRYRAIVLDPPTFGRGPAAEFWKIENDLADLLGICRDLFEPSGQVLLLLSCHTPGFTPLVLTNLLAAAFGDRGKPDAGEMVLPEMASARVLPSGVYARWQRD